MAYTKQITVITNDPALEQITALIEGNTSLAANASYLEILRKLQLGEWEEVIPLIKLLKAQYPGAKELELLLAEVKLRTEYDAAWDGKIKARRTSINLARFASRAIPAVLVVLLAIGSIFYIGNSRRISAMTQARDTLFASAQQAIVDGRFQAAFDLYGELLADEPDDASALSGQQEATRMMMLDADYTAILDKIDSGEFQAALGSLIGLQERSPGFRDVPALIDQLTNIADVEATYAKAEAAYARQDWVSAAEQYEIVRQINSSYLPERVNSKLVESYVNSGVSAVIQRPTEDTDLEQVQTYFQKALKLTMGEPTAKLEGELLDTYLDGSRQLERGNLKAGINELLPVYQSRPSYLDGYLADSLYEAYIELGQEAEDNGDLRKAMGFYGKAAALRVTERTVALQRLREVAIALTPTATPTETPLPPTPTGTPLPPTPVPTVPTSTPIPPTLADFRGWILFQSNRNGGSALFVMRPDGSDVQFAPKLSQEEFKELYDKEKWSPDGNARLYVDKVKNGGSEVFNIYKERADLPANWNRVSRMTDFDGTSYDPVWNPNNESVAFVSNVTGGDEIWVMHPDGRDWVQLTWNDWPWDKHPSWSPDGSQLLFWSNRTGMRHLWIMDPDGGNQRQLTTEYENWDPIWLK